MSFRVKDYYKNVVAEFDTLEDLHNYISASAVTSSLGEDDVPLNYFEYDTNLHSDLEISGSFNTDESKQLVRITYIPGEDDEVE
jgi:hypothetical protein